MPSTQISDLRLEKTSAILHLFLGGRTLTRKDVENRTGVSYGTVSIILRQLVASGVLRTVGKESSNGGRRADTYQLEPDAAHFAQISVTTTGFLWCLRDTHGVVRDSAVVRDDGTRDANAVLAEAVAAVVDASHTTAASAPLASIGVTIPGHYRPISDSIVKASRERVSQLRIRATVAPQYSGAVLVESDVNAAAVVEMSASDTALQDDMTTLFIVVTADGVGASILLGNSIHYGATGHAGEIHMIPVTVDGMTLPLGDVVDIDAVARRLATVGGLETPPDIDETRALIRAGSPAMEREYPRLVEAFAQALYVLDSILDPDVIVLAGPYVGFGPRWTRDITSQVVALAEPHLMDDLIIAAAPDSEDLDRQGMWRMQADAWFSTLD